MELWEWLLKADQQFDLSNPKTALAWLEKSTWWSKLNADHSKPVMGLESESAQTDWKRNVLSLRALAKKMKKKRVRQSPAMPSFQEALAALQSAVGMLKVIAVPVERPARLDILWLTYAVVYTKPDSDRAQRVFFPEYFWPQVFRSFVEGGSPVCERCGDDTGGLTKKGRQRRQRLCKKCRWLKWREKQSADTMRRKWRADKEEQRLKEQQRKQSGSNYL